jgi:DNA replication and repair protein RecF
MTLKRIEVSCVRNILTATLPFSPKINILYGNNGSGKTSVLEALYLLGLGRSFRTTKLNSLITHGNNMSTVFGLVDTGAPGEVPMGISRYRGGRREIQIAGRPVHLSSRLAELLPVQIMTPDSVQLLSGSPTGRRRFLNWGVFHVEHGFKKAWQVAEHSLKQRNALLRHAKIDHSILEIWTHQLFEAAQEIDRYRREYLEKFVPRFKEVLAQLLRARDIELSYSPGWDRSVSLLDALNSATDRDLKQGFTSLGHHRADIMLTASGRNVTDVFSRGEQKLAASALMMAQGQLMQTLTARHCTYLVDDLGSELDPEHRERLYRSFETLDCQVLVTAVDKDILAPYWSAKDTKLFHVEHGQVAPEEVK